MARLAAPVFTGYDTLFTSQGIDVVVTDGANVDWSDAPGQNLTRARSDGTNRLVMMPAQGNTAVGVAVDASYVYLALSGANSIVKIPK